MFAFFLETQPEVVFITELPPLPMKLSGMRRWKCASRLSRIHKIQGKTSRLINTLLSQANVVFFYLGRGRGGGNKNDARAQHKSGKIRFIARSAVRLCNFPPVTGNSCDQKKSLCLSRLLSWWTLNIRRWTVQIKLIW